MITFIELLRIEHLPEMPLTKLELSLANVEVPKDGVPFRQFEVEYFAYYGSVNNYIKR